MSEEIKMNDYFYLPVCGLGMRFDENQIKEKLSEIPSPFECIDHAINNHDRLTQENQRLIEALERLIETSDSNEEQLASELCEAYWPSSALKYAQQLLTELKGGKDD